MAVQNNIHANLPITEATIFIPLSVSSVPKPGYAIMTEVEALSDNKVVFGKRNGCSGIKQLLDRN